MLICVVIELNQAVKRIQMCIVPVIVHGCVGHDVSLVNLVKCVLWCAHAALTVDVFQDYGLDVNAFRELVTDCPQCLLELAATCCMVGR